MGKRSPGFEKAPRNLYPTPAAAVVPLLPHLSPATRFIEPCAGKGDLVRHLEAAGHICVEAYDVVPLAPGILVGDAAVLDITEAAVGLTNPPWDWPLLEPILWNLLRQRPTWLLLSADFLHNAYAAPALRHAHRIVSVGRVKWIPDSKHTGKDNAVWILFGPTEGVREFVPRIAKQRSPAAQAGTPKP